MLRVLALTWALALALASEEEFRLYESLLNGYDPLERPVENNSDPVFVELGIILQQIINIDEKNQIMETNVWLKYVWKDYKLRWISEFHGGINDIRFPKGTIWSPDVLLYNSADSEFDSTYESNLVVYSDGTVNWIPPGILKSSCKIDITWFPFDDQSCYLKFGSWTYHGFALDLQPEKRDGMDTSEFIENGEWEIVSHPVKRDERFYQCCPEPYPSLLFYLNIRRRTLYYGFNLIIPSLLMSFMTILGFTLPPDSCEKITLEITILLSVCFFLGIVASMTPPTSEAVPLIGTFFTCCMILVSASVVFTVFVLNLHFRTPDTHEISPFVRRILLNWLPWILMMKRPGHKFSRKAISDVVRACIEDEKRKKDAILQNIVFLEQNPLTGHLRSDSNSDLETRVNDCLKPYLENKELVDPGVQGMLMQLQTVHLELKFITSRMERDDDEDDVIQDWKFAAMVIDRLCLICFTIVIILMTCGIMFSAPHLGA